MNTCLAHSENSLPILCYDLISWYGQITVWLPSGCWSSWAPMELVPMALHIDPLSPGPLAMPTLTEFAVPLSCVTEPFIRYISRNGTWCQDLCQPQIGFRDLRVLKDQNRHIGKFNTWGHCRDSTQTCEQNLINKTNTPPLLVFNIAVSLQKISVSICTICYNSGSEVVKCLLIAYYWKIKKLTRNTFIKHFKAT